MTQEEKPHLKATDNQQGVNVVGAEVLHDGLQVELGQRPVVGERSAWRGGMQLTRVHLTSEIGDLAFPKARDQSPKGPSGRLRVG